MFNELDIGVLVVIFISVVWAFSSGFVKTFLGVSRLVLASYGSYVLRDSVTPLVANVTSNMLLLNYIAYIITFLTLLLLLSFVRRYLVSTLEFVVGSVVDRFFGATLGLIRAMVIVCGILIVWLGGMGAVAINYQAQSVTERVSYQYDRLPNIVKNAKSFNILFASIKLLVHFTPDELWGSFNAAKSELKSRSENMINSYDFIPSSPNSEQS
ncbi:MAG: CvpA family protein, partial [Pseudomonadota bacterium]